MIAIDGSDWQQDVKTCTVRAEQPCKQRLKVAPASAQAEQLSSSTRATKVKSASFYGKNKLLLVDERVARLYANIQQRLLNQQQDPFEHFALQRQAFAWAEAHECARDLK